MLARCLAHGIRIVSNFGAANPRGAARRIAALARELGAARAAHRRRRRRRPLRRRRTAPLLRAALGARARRRRDVVSANAYLGAEPIADALRAGARDRRLRPRRRSVARRRPGAGALRLAPRRLGPARRARRWPATCSNAARRSPAATSPTPASRTCPASRTSAIPIAEIDADGHCTITKAAGTGGRIDAHTVKEQLLYEVHDPAAYLTPDVVADICAGARRRARAATASRLDGVRGHPRPATLKVNVCHEDGWLAEGEISYAGPRAEARARLAAEVLRERLARARAAARRPDRRRQRLRRRRRPLARGARRDGERARRAPARRRRRTTTSAPGRAAAARGDGALHLRPGRRRRRAHRRCASASARVSCFVPRERVPARLRDDGAA